MKIEVSVTWEEGGVCLKYKIQNYRHNITLVCTNLYSLYKCEVLKCQLSFFNFTVNLLSLVKDVKKKVEVNCDMKFWFSKALLPLY